MIRVFFHLNVYEEDIHFFKVLRDHRRRWMYSCSKRTNEGCRDARILTDSRTHARTRRIVIAADRQTDRVENTPIHRESLMATKTSISKLLDPIIARFAPAYQAAVSKELKKYGLRIEDLYDPENDLDVEEAIGRLPQDVVDARNQRLKRAMDLSVKHAELPKELQEKQTPFAYYLKEPLAQIDAENEERAMLDASRPNERSIP